MKSAPGALVAALLCASCSARMMQLPADPGVPAPDGAEAFDRATSVCRAVSSLTVEIGVSGSVGGERLRARMLAGLASPDSARLEAFAFGQPVFILVTREGIATLLLTREGRVLEGGDPAAVLQALTGVPLDAPDLLPTLTGCAKGPGAGARSVGDRWRVIHDGDLTVYLQRASTGDPWRLVASVRRSPGRAEWRAEYREFTDDLPRDIRLRSSDGRQFDLRLHVADVEIGGNLDARVFEVNAAGASPITLEELQRSGPLASERRQAR
jgi:hypothetical protein